MSQFIEMFGTVENNTHNFPIMTIGEFANCFAGATPSTSHPEYWENGRIRWMSSGEVHKGHVEDTDSRITELGYKSASTRMVPIHSIVIAIAGQGKTRGTVAITEVDLCTNQSLCAIVPDERVNYSYLYHNLQGRYLELRGLSGDVNGRGGLNLKIIQKIPVILPPIEKQQQFASIAQQADKSKFGDFKSQFIEMFGNVENKPLVDVCIKRGEYGSNTPADDYDGNIRYVRITDITEEGNLNNVVVSPRKIEEKYMLLPGDLLFARTGNTVGKTYLHKSGKMIFAGYLIRYRLNKELMLPQFALAYTHTNQYYDWVEKIKKVGAQPNISAAQFDLMPIPVPTKDEQTEFVTMAEQADKSKSVIQKALVYLNDIQSDELKEIA